MGLICILKATGGWSGVGVRGVGVVTVTDSVYVSVGAVEADRLDKVSDRPGKINGWPGGCDG